jgi:hypothetical protein
VLTPHTHTNTQPPRHPKQTLYQTADLQRYMAFSHAPGSPAWAVLGEARDVLVAARGTIHEKAEVSLRLCFCLVVCVFL